MTGTAVTFSSLDWAIVALYFVANTAICVWCALMKERDTDRLLPRQPQRRLVPDRLLDLRLQHRRRAPGRAGRLRRGLRHGVRALGAALVSVLVLGWVFAPFYLRANIFTTPEFLEKRYTPATRTVLSLIFFVSYILTKASVTIFAGAFAIQTILGYQTRPSAAARRSGLLLVRGVLARDRHGHLRDPRRHEVGAVDRGHARAGAADRLDRVAGRRPDADRRPGCAACRQSRHHPSVAPAVDHARDAGLPRLPVRPSRRRGSA